MANRRRVVVERTDTIEGDANDRRTNAVADPSTRAPTNQVVHKKRQRQQTNKPVITIDPSSSSNNSSGGDEHQQPTKRQRKRHQTTSSGSGSRAESRSRAPVRPVDVIVIDDDAEPEAEPAPATTPSHPTPTASKAQRRPQTAAEMAQLDSDDYFEVLGLARDATDVDVKKAYRRLAIQWHPDKNRTNPEQAEEYFKRIAEAYEILSDPVKRRQYERYGKAGASGSSSASTAPGFSGNDRGFHHHGSHGGGFSSRHARDIFEAFFGGVDPFEAFFGSRTGSHRTGRRHPLDPFFADDDSDMGFGGMPSMMSMMPGFGSGGFGGFGAGSGRHSTFGSMGGADAFFSDSLGMGMNMGGGASFSSHSVSSSSYTDRHGHVVTTKTTTTTTPDGRTETTTEEFRNGKLVTSSSASTSRLAGAGRMQLEGSAGSNSRGSSRAGSAARRDRRQ